MPQEDFHDSTKDQIIKDSSKFITSTYLGNVTGIITGILTLEFLGPALMGVWSYIQVIQNYFNFSNLGIISAAERELPYYFGKKDLARSEKIKNNAFTFTFIISFLIFLGLVAYAFGIKHRVSTPYFYGLLTVAILAFGAQYGLFYTVLLRANKNFSILSQAKVIFALTWLVLTISLVIPFNIYGIYLVAIGVMIADFSFCYYKTRFSFNFELDFNELKRLFLIGAPLLLLSIGIISIKNIDKIFIGNMLGSEHLGYYSMAIMASDYIFSIPVTFSIVMFPRFQESYALKDNIADIQNFVNTPTQILSYFIAIIIGFAFLTLPPVIMVILPQYIEGIMSAKILLLGTFFISLTHPSNQFLITLNKQIYIIPLVFFAVVIGGLLDYLFIKWGYGINGVALGTGIANFLYYFLILGYAMLHYADIKFILKFMAGNLFPFLLITGFLLVITRFVPLNPNSWFSLFISTMFSVLLLGILCLPLLWYIDRKTDVLKRVFKIIREKMAHQEAMWNRIKALYQQIIYLAKVLFLLPNTFFKRVVFGNDPVWKAFFFQTWGRLPKDLEEMLRSRESIWINTEAGGEITQVFSLCRMLKEQFPKYNLLISTHKYDAYLLAQKIDGVDYTFFSPWDINWVVRKLLKKINPRFLLAIEIANAPVLFREAHLLGIKTFLCSAFMSKNLDKHRILKRAMSLEFYKHFDFIAVKHEIDKQGFEKLGYPADSVKILGNLKYDTTKLKTLGKSRVEWLKELGLKTENKVLLGGSIHPGEEKFLIDAYALLRKQDPQFRLIIAPRFTQFISQVESYLNKLGLPFIRRTEIKKGIEVGNKVIILDTFGELAYLYAVASCALIGSSIISVDPLGGHNIIEPLIHEVPVFHGPHMFKLQEIVDELKECWQGLEIRSSEELAKNILILEENNVLKDKIQEKMREIGNRHKDSAERHVMAIKRYLSNTQTD